MRTITKKMMIVMTAFMMFFQTQVVHAEEQATQQTTGQATEQAAEQAADQAEATDQATQEPTMKQLWEYSEEELVAWILMQTVTDDMDPFQKAAAINDYLCNTMEYDYTYSHRTTFDALAYGTGVCQGYANAFQRLMTAAGVETDYVSGYAYTGKRMGKHGWNRILVDGVYYYVDVCWNDAYHAQKYFLLSEEQMGDHYMARVNPHRVM